jgi:hypothetical protein
MPGSAAYKAKWYRANRERILNDPKKRANIKAWREKNSERFFKNLDIYRARLKKAVHEVLGNRCASITCCWHNNDGSVGCNDSRMLQIDHINGGGTKERRELSGHMIHLKILKMPHPENEYQLLCANCNWAKRFEKGEWRLKKLK